jgi:hypothetical protein
VALAEKTREPIAMTSRESIHVDFADEDEDEYVEVNHNRDE